MSIMNIPWDVATQWNSTFDMLNYTLKYWQVVNQVTQQRDLGLHKYEMLDEEWQVVDQLCSILEVGSVTMTLQCVGLVNCTHDSQCT